MSNRSLIPIAAHSGVGRISEAEYFRLYEQSLADPDRFWGEQGKRIDWIKPYTKIGNASFTGDVSIRWYEDGTLNASYNCIDRHLAKRGDQTAILWEGDDPSEDKRVTYRELHEAVCRLANVLKSTTGSWHAVFYVAAVLNIVAALMALFVLKLQPLSPRLPTLSGVLRGPATRVA